MTKRARRGLGWAIIGLLMALAAWVALVSGVGAGSAVVELIADLLVLAGITFTISGLLVTAVSLIRD